MESFIAFRREQGCGCRSSFSVEEHQFVARSKSKNLECMRRFRWWEFDLLADDKGIGAIESVDRHRICAVV